MHKAIVAAALLLTTSTIALAQQDRATDITAAQVQQVLKAPSKIVDHTLKVVDLGKYALSVAVIKRGPSRAPGAAAPPSDPNAVKCGLTAMPAGAKEAAEGGIVHDDTDETYIVISGSGTLITGGQILNGTRSAPDSEVTKILNGPSCSGKIVGNFVARKVGVGDISVIPKGVAHGWADITDEVTYLSVRPDPKKVLEHGYVNPAIK
jgi:hypothetical protein